MNVITILESVALSVTTKDESPQRLFRFFAGDKAEQNLNADDQEFPAIYLDTPIESNWSLKQSGYIEKSYVIVVLFFDKATEDATDDEHNTIIHSMELVAEYFLQKLSAHTQVRYIENITGSGIKRVFDSDLSGYMLNLLLTPFNDTTSCQ